MIMSTPVVNSSPPDASVVQDRDFPPLPPPAQDMPLVFQSDRIEHSTENPVDNKAFDVLTPAPAPTTLAIIEIHPPSPKPQRLPHTPTRAQFSPEGTIESLATAFIETSTSTENLQLPDKTQQTPKTNRLSLSKTCQSLTAKKEFLVIGPSSSVEVPVSNTCCMACNRDATSAVDSMTSEQPSESTSVPAHSITHQKTPGLTSPTQVPADG